MSTLVFRNVRVFPGFGEVLLPASDVVVEGSTITSITAHDPSQAPDDSATMIDGQGRTLLPGLIDAHWHAAFTSVPAQVALLADSNFLALVSSRRPPP